MSGPPRWQKRPLIIARVLSVILLVALAYRPAFASSRAEKNQDIVFIVDISSSMRNIFGDVKRAIFDFVLQARPGDNVVLITFGENVTLRFRQNITSEQDVQLVERELESLEPDQYFTYITGALDKGLEELRLLERKYPDHLRTMVLMSDGKNNSPDSISDPVTFDDILERYPGLFKKSENAFFYLSLGDDPDPQVLSLMESVEGSSFNMAEDVPDLVEDTQPLAFAQIFVEPISIDLGMIAGPKAMVSASLAFFPARGDPSKKIITTAMSARFKDNPSWRTVAEVAPSAVNCSRDPWSTSFVFNIDSLQEGTIVGTLELKPLPGQVLFIDPSEIPVTMTIRQPYVKVIQKGRLEFGPIDSRRIFQETQRVLLMPNPAAVDEVIQARCDIAVPEGMKVTTNVEKRDNTQELVVTVSTDEAFSVAHSMTLEGAIELEGSKHATSFSENHLEVQIEVAPPPGGSRRIFDAVAGFFSRFGKLIASGLIIVLLVSIAGMATYWWLRLRPQSALEGKLVLLNLKGKSPDKSKPIVINLHTIGKSIGHDSLTIGSSTDAGITLSHKSVAAHHCEIYVRMDKGKKRVLIEPVGKNPLIVNLQKITEPMPLSDRDLLEIGAYAFRFENPHPYRQIVVRYISGRILKGTPATWDIESDGFSLLPRDALPGSKEEIFVSFTDLKAVYFVRDFDGQLGKKIVSPASQIHGIHMRLTFHDGEVLEGFTSENYNPSGERFYFFPADQSGNTISMVVEREHLRNLEILDSKGRSNPGSG